MGAKRLRKSDIRLLSAKVPISIKKSDSVVIVDDKELLLNDDFVLFKESDSWVPSLKLLLTDTSLLPHVVVDMGAVRFIVQGADIMHPGIVSFPDVKEGDFVAVVDERFKKPLCVGKMLLSSEDAKKLSSGKVISNIHYVSDALWKKYY